MAKPKKADVVAELEKLGIKFDATLTVDELVKLLPEVAGVQDVPVETPVAATEEKPLEVGGKDTATVYSKNGAAVRTYSKEVHGKEFKALAAEYAGKIKGTSK